MKLRNLLLSFLLSISFVSFQDTVIVNASSEVSNDKQVEQVIDLIASLPLVCTLADEGNVKNARLAYDNLLPYQKVNVTNLLDLLDRENQIALLYSEISYVKGLIDALPSESEFELNNEVELNEVVKYYNELDNLQKELVSNYNKLLLLIERKNSIYKAIDEVINLINNLPSIEDIDSSIYSKIESIEVIYNSLSEYQRSYITNINKYHQIKEKLDAINLIIDNINNIPDKLSLDSLELLESIEQEYEKLTDKQKSLVSNYKDFYRLYSAVLEAIEFNIMIEEFTVNLDLNNKYILDYLMLKYSEFTDNQKVFITNYNKLILLLEEIDKEEEYYLAAQGVIKLINDLPLEVELEDKTLINEVRCEYDKLHDKSKRYVDNYHLLLQKEAIIVKLENELEKENLNNLYKEVENIINDINNIKEEVNEDQKESELLIEDINKFIEETKENEAKGFNKYLIIAIGLTSVFIIIAIIYVFSLQHKKINIDNEIY